MSVSALSGEELHNHWCPSTTYNCLLSCHRTLLPTSNITTCGSENVKLVQKVAKLCVDTRKSLKDIACKPVGTDTLVNFAPFVCDWE